MIRVSDLPLFDAAEFLTTPTAQAEYIALALEDGDAEEIRRAHETVARAKRMHGKAEVQPPTGEPHDRPSD